MVIFEQLVDRVLAKHNHETGTTEVDRETAASIARATIEGLGFYIASTTGEVCDPRPKPVVTFPSDNSRRRTRWRR